MNPYDFHLSQSTEFTEDLERVLRLIRNNANKQTLPLKGEKLLTKKDVMKLLHISERTLHTYRAEGKIPFIRLYGKILYIESEILKLLEYNHVEAIKM